MQLSEAFRSLLRPSSPVGTKAFTISPLVPHTEAPGDSHFEIFSCVRISSNSRICFVCLILVCLYSWKLCYFPTKLLEFAVFLLLTFCNFATRMSICFPLQCFLLREKRVIRLIGLEPMTPRLSSACSNRLSYSRLDLFEGKDRDAHREPDAFSRGST